MLPELTDFHACESIVMPIAYRTILRVDSSSDLLRQTTEIVGAWLAEKGIPAPDQPGVRRFDERQLAIVESHGANSVARRWELKEPWDPPQGRGVSQVPGDVAVTSITVVQSGDEAWLWIDINSPRVKRTRPDGTTLIEAQEAGTPRLVAELIAQLAPNDGLAETYTGPLVVASAKQVPQLVRALRDATRVGAVFVSSPPSQVALNKWIDTVTSITRGTQGLGSSYIVAPAALDEFNRLMARSHSVHPGMLRSYLPDAIPGDISDSFRHKVLRPTQIATFPVGRLRRILRSSQVERLASLRLPDLLQRADYDLLRRQRLQPLVDISTLQEKALNSRARRDVDELLELNDALSARLEAQKGDALEALEQAIGLMGDIQELRDSNELLQLEVDEETSRREEADDVVSVLRKRLKLAKAFDDAFAPVADDERTVYPDSFEELVGRLPEFDCLLYVGDPADPLKLDDHPNMQPAIHKAWDTLATLNDYAKLTVSGQFTGGLRRYLDDPNHDGTRRILNYKAGEGEQVRANPQLAGQREVRVSTDIDPSGITVMTAHIPLLTHRARSPRLYFEDRVMRNQKVLVGYIGEHLLNVLG